MGFYGGYRGRSVGRILGYIERYCGLREAEFCTVYGDHVEYGGKTIAHYQFVGDSDVAEFTFFDKNHIKNYHVWKDFIDDPLEIYLCNLPYCLQELARYLRGALAGSSLLIDLISSKWLYIEKKEAERLYPKLIEAAQWLNENYYNCGIKRHDSRSKKAFVGNCYGTSSFPLDCPLEDAAEFLGLRIYGRGSGPKFNRPNTKQGDLIAWRLFLI